MWVCMGIPQRLAQGIGFVVAGGPVECHTGAVGDDRSVVFVCPALAGVKACYAALATPSSRMLRTFGGKTDLIAIMHINHGCFRV